MGALATTATSYLDSQVVTDLGTVITSVTSWITGSTYLKVFFSLGLVGISIAIFHRLKNIVR